MKKLLLVLLSIYSLFGASALAQSRATILRQLRQFVGEPDTAGTLTNIKAREFLNGAVREFALWGTVQKRQILTGATGRDTFQLNTDFLFPLSVQKTLVNRSHKLALSPISPDSANTAYLRNMPNGFLFERTDTIKQSVAKPDTFLAQDVYIVRSAYRKEAGTGKLIWLVQIPPESLSRVANTASDYFYFTGQPYPKVTFGKKATFGDTVFAEVLAIIPRYFIYDVRGAASDAGRRMLHLFPPMVRADSVYLIYGAVVDSVINGADAANWDSAQAPIGDVEKTLRPALIYWMAAAYYRMIQLTAEGDYFEQRWREILTRWAISRGLSVPTSK